MNWFTSDTHFGHANIVRGTSAWTDKSRCRPFDTIEEHDDRLVETINGLVRSNDVLYHMGDWSFGGFANIREFWERLICKNIHLILGNHDHHIERNKDGCRGLFKSVQPYKEITIGGQKIILCHYAMRVWNHSSKGSWMLYGHSHGTLDEMKPEIANPTWVGDDYFIKNYKTMDVGIDTNVFMPYSFDELELIMQKRTVELEVDHHNKQTNN